MKPKIYVHKRLPIEIALKLQEKFQVAIWEEEDFELLEQAIEKADGDRNHNAYFEA